MTDHTQLLIKATIIEDAAVRAMQLAEDPTYTDLGRVALRHVAAAHIWTISVLTAETQSAIRMRVIASARDRKPLDQYRPRMVG